MILAPCGHSKNTTGDNPIRSDYVFSPPKFRAEPAAARNNVSFISAAAAVAAVPVAANTANAARNVNWILIDAENNPLPSQLRGVGLGGILVLRIRTTIYTF